MGNIANIAYGGWTLAIAANAAYQSAPPSYHLYSMLGHFLGPALTDRKLFCTVRKIRDTRTLATRQVEVSQAQDDGSTFRRRRFPDQRESVSIDLLSVTV